MSPIRSLHCVLALSLALPLAGCGGDPAQASTDIATRNATAAVAATDDAAALPPPFDPGLEAYERAQLPDAVAALSGIERAAWVSESTLVVELGDVEAGGRAHLCPMVERYVSQRAVRLQLQPPSGSDAPVRFLQCRPY